MINPAAIDAFLARKLENYDWLKAETPDQIEAALNGLNPVPVLGNLWLHQKVCFLLLEAFRRFMLHIDMGGGKTLITLSLLKYRKQRGEKPKAVVFVPYITAVETWIEETQKHAPELVCVPLLGSSAENARTLANSEGDLYVFCYQSAVAMLSESVPVPGKKKTKWIIEPKVVRKAFESFDTIVMDEIHKCKSVSSLTYRMCRTISAQCDYAMGLTGTPFGKDLQDLWPQFNLIDFGDTLGESLTFYRSVFFKQKVNYWGGYEYTFNKKLFGKLQRIIKNCSIRYSVDEFADMPPRKYIPRYLTPNEGIKAYADTASKKLREIIASTGKDRYQQVESEYLKLRQLSSGFMTVRGEDTGKLEISFDENPKLDALQELLEAMPLDSKMVVFHHFVYTNQLISDRLKLLKIKHARVYGKTRDPIAELRKFKTDPECRVLVLNSKSGSSSLNLQIAQYGVFFEGCDSPIDRQQAEGRLWRSGQTKRVIFYDLLMKSTADERIHKANSKGISLLKAFLDGTEGF